MQLGVLRILVALILFTKQYCMFFFLFSTINFQFCPTKNKSLGTPGCICSESEWKKDPLYFYFYFSFFKTQVCWGCKVMRWLCKIDKCNMTMEKQSELCFSAIVYHQTRAVSFLWLRPLNLSCAVTLKYHSNTCPTQWQTLGITKLPIFSLMVLGHQYETETHSWPVKNSLNIV